MHWHPNADEWQYYIEGQGRMGVFGASGQARTFDFQAGDVGYVFRHGALHRESRHHAVALSGDVQERLLRRFVAGHMAGADSAGIATGASEARSASGGRVAQEQDADRAGLSGHSIIPTKGLGTAVGDAEKRV